MIPNKIKNNYKMLSKKNNKYNTIIDGILSCCNDTCFKIEIAGSIKKSLLGKLYLYSENDEIALIACCKKCNKKICVFNSRCDGYDNCDKFNNEDISTNKLTYKKCNNNNFSISIKYENLDIDELKESKIKNIDNAFTWVWVSLKCNECGTKYNKFIDYECS